MPDFKNAKANELLGKAQALADEINDTSKALTTEEVEARMKDIGSLKARAAAIEGLTPKDQAKDKGLVPLDPEARGSDEDAADAPSFKERSEAVVKAFGGFGRYMKALAHQGSNRARPWTERQRKAHELMQRAMVGTASDASGGEFLLPLTQAPDIFVGAAILQPGLFERAPKYTCPGRSVKIPYLAQDLATNTRPLSSIAATGIIGEGSSKTEATIAIDQREVVAYKWAAYTEIADELLEDDYTGGLPSVVSQAIGGDLVNSVNLAVTRTGTGSSQPMGALHTNNTALITVNRETSQTVTVGDVLGMLAKATMGPGSFWIAHPALIPAIYGLALSSGSQVTFLNNLRDGAGAQLLGLPIVWSHLMSAKGVAGDLALIDPSQYAAVLRKQVTMESSTHYKFQHDITAYRLLVRAGGAPIPAGEYSFSAAGSALTYAYSGFVRLGDDVTS